MLTKVTENLLFWLHIIRYIDIILFLIGCNDTWLNFQDSCYKLFSSNNTNQQKAEVECVRNGGHLVAISSKEEMSFVHQLLIEMSESVVTDKVYIGVYAF